MVLIISMRKNILNFWMSKKREKRKVTKKIWSTYSTTHMNTPLDALHVTANNAKHKMICKKEQITITALLTFKVFLRLNSSTNFSWSSFCCLNLSSADESFEFISFDFVFIFHKWKLCPTLEFTFNFDLSVWLVDQDKLKVRNNRKRKKRIFRKDVEHQSTRNNSRKIGRSGTK